MARKEKTSTVHDLNDESIDQPKVAGAMALMRTEAAGTELALAERDKAVQAVARELGYDGPISAAALMDGARSAKRRVGMAIMEFGAYLAMIKAGCKHGEFEPALMELEVAPRTAQIYMLMARRFSKAQSTALLNGLGFGKAAELLPLEDAEIDELAEFGQTGELALDDVARMSLKELREAVRKVRAEKERLKKVAEEAHAEVVKIKLERKVVAHTDWPDALVPLTDQVAAAGRKIAQGLSELETCRIALFSAGAALEGDDQARFEAAMGHVADVYEEALARAERKLQKERLTFDQTLGNLAGGQA